jgi:hypothetical protein
MFVHPGAQLHFWRKQGQRGLSQQEGEAQGQNPEKFMPMPCIVSIFLSPLMHCIAIRYFLLENIYNYFPLESILYSFLETNVISPLEKYLNNSIQYCFLHGKNSSSLEYKKRYVASTNVYCFLQARYIYDVFITINDDALDILLDVYSMTNFVGSAFQSKLLQLLLRQMFSMLS